MEIFKFKALLLCCMWKQGVKSFRLGQLQRYVDLRGHGQESLPTYVSCLIVPSTLLQGLMQNSNISIQWMSQDQTTGLTEFSNMCISTGTMDISDTFQYPQWKFPTLSNINIGIFLYISLHRVEFSNILQHIQRNYHCVGSQLQMSVISNPITAKADSRLRTCSSSIFNILFKIHT